jgi:hypothetical protein
MQRALRTFGIVAVIVAIFAGRAQADLSAGAAPTYDQLVFQAQRLQQNGETLAGFCDFVDAYTMSPGQDPAAQALLDSLRTGNLPVHAPIAELSKLIGASGSVSAQSMSDGNIVAISTHDELPAISDPQNGWPFTRVMWFYRRTSRVAGDMTCFAAIRYQTSDDQSLAERMGRLLCDFRDALVEKTGYFPLCDGQPFTVWLCRHSTDAGGEQWQNNIYFYDVTNARSSIEWIREIAHEYSHMAFPLVGGDYSEPEAWANGYYGERLLLRWVARGAAGGPAALEAAWGGTFTGYVNYENKRIIPALAIFDRYGLDQSRLDRRDAGGMNYLFGMLLSVDDKAGPKAIADLLWNLPQRGLVDPKQLVPGVRAALARGAQGAAKNAGDTESHE